MRVCWIAGVIAGILALLLFGLASQSIGCGVAEVRAAVLIRHADGTPVSGAWIVVGDVPEQTADLWIRHATDHNTTTPGLGRTDARGRAAFTYHSSTSTRTSMFGMSSSGPSAPTVLWVRPPMGPQRRVVVSGSQPLRRSDAGWSVALPDLTLEPR